DRTRFPVEGLSYEYLPRVSGKTFAELAGNGVYGLHEIWMTFDFDPVHGTGATSRTFLYADGHVERIPHAERQGNVGIPPEISRVRTISPAPVVSTRSPVSVAAARLLIVPGRPAGPELEEGPAAPGRLRRPW